MTVSSSPRGFRRTVFSAFALGLACALAGCSTSGTNAKPAPSPSASTSTTPSASATPAPQDVLFTIAANVRGKDGSTIAILMTAHKPLPYSDADAKSLETEFLAACGANVGDNPVTTDSLSTNGSILMSIDLASSVANKTFVSPLEVQLGSPYFGESVKGSGFAPTDSTQPCTGGYTWSTAGTGHAVADFESGNPGPDLLQWRYAYYGFSVDPSSNATIEACKVTLTDLTEPADLSTIQGWDTSTAGSGIACGIGYAGE